jgi:hypothetical protein
LRLSQRAKLDILGRSGLIPEWRFQCIQIVGAHRYELPTTAYILVQFVLQIDEGGI